MYTHMNKNKLKFILLSVLVAITLFFVIEREFLPGSSPQDSSENSFKILSYIISLIKDDYVEQPDPLRTMDGAFRGMVDSLDILSSYFDRGAAQRYKDRTQTDLKESGLILYKSYNSFPMVIGIKEGAPITANGPKVGDVIYALDGRSTLHMSMLEVNLYQKDPEAKPFAAKISQATEGEMILIERKLLVDSPFSYTKSDGLEGILTIHNFFPELVTQIRNGLLPQLKTQKQPLIIDLRNCHEGQMQEAIKFINLFLQKDNIGHLENKDGQKKILACPDTAELAELPLIIWTNQATIGPAEMVSQVLQLDRNAKIIGSRTPGLVAAQEYFAFEDGTGMLLTTDIFQPPVEDKFWLKGVKPDLKIDSKDQTLDIYIQETRKLISLP